MPGAGDPFHERISSHVQLPGPIGCGWNEAPPDTPNRFGDDQKIFWQVVEIAADLGRRLQRMRIGIECVEQRQFRYGEIRH